MKKQELSKVVQGISKINFAGNIIPTMWFHHIKYTTVGKSPKSDKPAKPKTKTDLLAINILADICYWYRATEVRDEKTGKVVEYKQKFWADKLQKSYSDYAELFGQPKSGVKASIDLLISLGLITREFQSITVKGVELHNVMYLEPIIEGIEKITNPSPKNLGEGIEKIDTPPQKNWHTNTEITTEITTEKNELMNGKSLSGDFERQSLEIFPEMAVEKIDQKMAPPAPAPAPVSSHSPVGSFDDIDAYIIETYTDAVLRKWNRAVHAMRTPIEQDRWNIIAACLESYSIDDILYVAYNWKSNDVGISDNFFMFCLKSNKDNTNPKKIKQFQSERLDSKKRYKQESKKVKREVQPVIPVPHHRHVCTGDEKEYEKEYLNWYYVCPCGHGEVVDAWKDSCVGCGAMMDTSPYKGATCAEMETLAEHSEALKKIS